jgi:hypothetical protein
MICAIALLQSFKNAVQAEVLFLEAEDLSAPSAVVAQVVRICNKSAFLLKRFLDAMFAHHFEVQLVKFLSVFAPACRAR